MGPACQKLNFLQSWHFHFMHCGQHPTALQLAAGPLTYASNVVPQRTARACKLLRSLQHDMDPGAFGSSALWLLDQRDLWEVRNAKVQKFPLLSWTLKRPKITKAIASAFTSTPWASAHTQHSVCVATSGACTAKPRTPFFNVEYLQRS